MADLSYVVQPRPAGLCDALFRALPLIHPDEEGAPQAEAGSACERRDDRSDQRE